MMRSAALVPQHHNSMTIAQFANRQSPIHEVPMRQRVLLATLLAVLFSSATLAADSGKVRGIVHDPQHRPIAGASVTLRTPSSTWLQTSESDSEGEFHFADVPLRNYTVSVTAPGFRSEEHTSEIQSLRHL